MPRPVSETIQSLKQHLGTHRRYLLTTHVGPDGDGLGSALALSSLLRHMGKEAMVVVVDPLPEKFGFLLEGFPEDTLRSYPQEIGPAELAGFDTVVLLDCGVWARLGPLLEALDLKKASTVCIDHHVSSEDPAEITILDERATATATLVHRLFQEWGVPIGKPEATALYVALMTETGSFRFSNTDPMVHRTVADLLAAGVVPDRVYRTLYEEKPLSALRLTGHGYRTMRIEADGAVVVTSLGKATFQEFGAEPEDADGLVNQILALKGAQVAILVYERPQGGIKVSFRSKHDVDVQKLAARLGGGGHRKAAGATLDTTLEEAVEQVVGLAVAAVSARPA